MVFFLAISAKSALTTGALIGGTVALYANREKILDFLVHEWEEFSLGFCSNEPLRMACSMEDGELRDFDGEDEAKFSDGELTTPDLTDIDERDEVYDDLEWEKRTESSMNGAQRADASTDVEISEESPH